MADAPNRPNSGARYKASVLVCTGVDDPPAPPRPVVDFETELRTGGVGDRHAIACGNTLHGFTNPAANGAMMRTALDHGRADRRSGRRSKARLMKP
ncbi:dienelactone hydrolase family protein [Bradyrhizobium roseum]|uniref:hypothetical protein n=1 Tax=Bradyrhizobium roseum TaxID=3056648 RepID=UPI0026242A6C|nr:hypothetical protein [Bradyrhizobium roseus]WKA26538.1 hypothetical protein QUH67_23470 [Bradyrhizobium roseus]